MVFFASQITENALTSNALFNFSASSFSATAFKKGIEKEAGCLESQ